MIIINFLTRDSSIFIDSPIVLIVRKRKDYFPNAICCSFSETFSCMALYRRCQKMPWICHIKLGATRGRHVLFMKETKNKIDYKLFVDFALTSVIETKRSFNISQENMFSCCMFIFLHFFLVECPSRSLDGKPFLMCNTLQKYQIYFHKKATFLLHLGSLCQHFFPFKLFSYILDKKLSKKAELKSESSNNTRY